MWQFIFTLAMFQPLLWELSKKVNQVPFIGQVDHVLIYVAILTSIVGTFLLAVVRVRLLSLNTPIQPEFIELGFPYSGCIIASSVLTNSFFLNW
ncbi:SbmA/BacA-like family transporter [Endozoicomonas acroporae]|uniref:SbmA/BacA-like family transporter n=1 Tax=Endozoicomonas acroporae TaxID=1701104 RepID=UPI000C760377